MMNSKLLFIIVLILFAYPKINYAQAPVLGATSGFAFFTAAGAFSNTGATVITGDIGTNAGAVTGFPLGIVIGQIHVADSLSARAAADIGVAYTFLGGITCDTTIGTSMGNNDTLKSGVYCTTAATFLNGNLILDGKGDTSALFIFKINGAFVTGAFSRVILINSASIRNVYWRINGAADFGDSSVFRGTVIANGALNVLQGASVQGRGLTQAGAISLNTTRSALPVKLLSFRAARNDQDILLTWSTATEINNDYFSIERGTDGTNWEVIGKIAGWGNSYTQKNYSFYDKEVNNGISYYRLKQTDLDGKFVYSAIITAFKDHKENAAELTVFPNPTNGQVSISVSGEKDQSYTISVYNVTGKNVYTSINHSTIDLSDLRQGIYFLHFSTSTKTIIRKLTIEK